MAFPSIINVSLIIFSLSAEVFYCNIINMVVQLILYFCYRLSSTEKYMSTLHLIVQIML